MAKHERIHQVVFGETGGSTEFGKIGSDAAGSPTTTKDLALIQSLAQFQRGLFGITASAAEPPRIEDLNALYFLLTSQLGYILQNGVPEWHEDAEYYATVSYCQKGGIIYRSVTGTDGSPNLNNDPATDDGTNWEAGEASYRQLKWDLDTLGFTGYALYTDKYLADKLRIARRAVPGETIFSSFKITPTKFSLAKSSANPSYPDYAPYIDRSVDQNISTANYPLLASLRNIKASVKGVTDFTVTVSGSDVTFPNTPEGIAMVQKIIDDAKVSGWLNSGQTVDAAADYTTAATQLYLNIAGTDYAITNATLSSRIVVVSGSPTTGSQTAILYPFRNSSATGIRLRKLTGFVPVADGDSDGESVNGLRCMDRGQGHWHGINPKGSSNTNGDLCSADGSGGAYGINPAGAFSATTYWKATHMDSDGTNGTPRTGKTTRPLSFGQYVYTFAGVYI